MNKLNINKPEIIININKISKIIITDIEIWPYYSYQKYKKTLFYTKKEGIVGQFGTFYSINEFLLDFNVLLINNIVYIKPNVTIEFSGNIKPIYKYFNTIEEAHQFADTINNKMKNSIKIIPNEK